MPPGSISLSPNFSSYRTHLSPSPLSLIPVAARQAGGDGSVGDGGGGPAERLLRRHARYPEEARICVTLGRPGHRHLPRRCHEP
jgi:hypothetical protein